MRNFYQRLVKRSS